MGEIVQQTSSGLDIIPSSLELVELEKQIAAFDFSSLAYDYILLDCPPNMAGNTVAAIRASDGVLVPTTADCYAYKSVKAIADSLKTIDRKLNGIILTRFTGRLVLTKQIYEDLKDLAADLGTKLYNTAIRECVAVRESQLMQQDIFTYAPNSTAAEDYEAIVNEILQEE
jgi:chromosome partitioning protein